MFHLEKLLAPLFYPLSGGLLLVLLGLHALWVGRRPARGRVLVTLGAAVLTVFGYAGPAKRLLHPLESAYPAFDPRSLDAPADIVVLGGGYAAGAAGWPVSSRIGRDALPRIVEGVRIARACPDARLVLSLGAGHGEADRRGVVAELASLFAIDPARIRLLAPARDTGEEAAAAAERAGPGPVVLVTSASHMPRAVDVFEAAGVVVLPAPCDPRAVDHGPFTAGDVWPAAVNLRLAERAVHEGLGRMARRGARRPTARGR